MKMRQHNILTICVKGKRHILCAICIILHENPKNNYTFNNIFIFLYTHVYQVKTLTVFGCIIKEIKKKNK